MIRKSHSATWRACLRASSALFALTVSATAVQPQEVPSEEPVDLGTLILNVRKVDETIRRVPFNLSVIPGDAVEGRRIDDTVDLARATPGLNLGDTGLRGSNIPNIRGVGTFFPLSADDSSVPVFIDGVPLAVRSQDRAIFDVDTAQVLRGPQNTIYGRNAQAGAINITTADPTFSPLYRLNAEVGEDGYGRLRAVASGPLSDQFAYRFSGQLVTTDGDIPNLSSVGGDLRESDQINLNAKFLWQPSADTDVRLSLRYGDYDEVPTQGVLLQDGDFPQTWVDFLPDYDLTTQGLALTVEHQFDGVRFTSVTGIQAYESTYRADDSDGFVFQALTGFPPGFADDPTSDFRTISDDDIQYSQEFRFDGALANGGTWVAGISGFRSDLDLDLTFNATGFINGDFANSFTTESASVFGEVTMPLSDRVNVSAGLRYTNEKKSFTSRFSDQSGGLFGADTSDSGSDTFAFLTGRLGMTYDISPDLTVFASIARGAKSGGFQLADTDLANGFGVSDYKSAFTNTFELGLRGTSADGRFDFATSVFYNDTKDEHLQVFDLATFQSVIENADTESYGFELEAGYQATDAWRLEGALALLEAEITRSNDPTVSVGNDVPFAPSLSLGLAVEYASDLTLFNQAGEFSARAEYQYVGERQIDPQNRDVLDSYGIVNLRFGWQHNSTQIYAFADNVFDETYAESGFVFGNSPSGDLVSIGVPGQSRRIGLGVDMTF